MLNKLLDECQLRDDEWARCVCARLMHIRDIPMADAVCHQQCRVAFHRGKAVPKKYATPKDVAQKKQKVGRPSLNGQADEFLMVA